MRMFEQKQIIINRLVVNYLTRTTSGDTASAIVFLHGWRSSSAVWLPVLPSFQQLKIYAFDLPGFGKSQTPPDTFDFDDYVELVHDAMVALGIQSCVLVGHSFGGRIAIALSSRYPETVRRLVLAGASGIRMHAGITRAFAAVAHLFKPLFSVPGLSAVRTQLYRLIGADDYLATPRLRKVFVRVVQYDVRALLPKVLAPTLIIWGKKDTQTPLWAGKLMQQEIPDARLVVFARSGHMSFVEQPKEFSSAVLDFIA